MFKRVTLTFVVLLFAAAPATAQQATNNGDLQQLEAQSQAIKSQVLDLEAELSALEQDVRYPENSRWTVFVTADADADTAPKALELQVGGRVIASHQYSSKEQAALRAGGAHRLYIGNLSPGKHQIRVRFTSTNSEQGNSQFTVNKPVGARLLELHWQPDASETLAHNSLADTP